MTSSNPDYAFLHKLADAADAKTMQHFRSGYEVVNKLEAGFDPVTIADRSAEEAIRAVLEVERPDHGSLARNTAGPVKTLKTSGSRPRRRHTLFHLWNTAMGHIDRSQNQRQSRSRHHEPAL